MPTTSKNILFFLGVLWGCVEGPSALAQTSATDTGSVAAAVASLHQRYQRQFDDQSTLYSGAEYVDYTRFFQAAQAHQFYPSAQAVPGNIVYGGYAYSGVPLLYDIRLDQLVVRHPTNSFLFRLVSNQVSGFTIDGHQFTRVTGDSTRNRIETGFYEVLLDGTTQLLARHHKEMLEQPANGLNTVNFTYSNQLFVRQEGNFSPVAGKQDIIRLFPAHKKQLQKYTRDNRLKFKKETIIPNLIQLVEYAISLPVTESVKN